MKFFLIVSLLLHIFIIGILFSSKRASIALNATSFVDVAMLETKTPEPAPPAPPSNLENESIVPSAYEKVQKSNAPAPEAESTKVLPQKLKATTVATAAAPIAAQTAPVPVQNVTSTDIGINAKYPRLSRMLSEQGKVIVFVKTNEAGQVYKMSILTGSGFKRLDDAALEALSSAQTRTLSKSSEYKISFLFRLK